MNTSESKVACAFAGLVALCMAASTPGCGTSGTDHGATAADGSVGGTGTGGSGFVSAGGSIASGGAGTGTSGAGGSAGASTGGVAGTAASGGATSTGGAGSGGAGNGGAGSGGAPAYDPCPTNGNPCRVMPLGDSITDGCCGENTISQGASYRYELFHLSLANGKKLTFVGSHQSGPNQVDGVTFPKSQEGHSAYTIAPGGGRSGLQPNIVNWLKGAPPDIVTLMIGTNDVGISLDLPNAPKRLGVLLDSIIATSPKALIVLAQIVPSGDDNMNQRARTFNDAMPALVQERTDAGKHIVLVDMYDAFTKDTAFKTKLLWMKGLHPSDAGYSVMANVWWDAIGGLLPAK